MPVIYLTDRDGQVWRALEHGERYRTDGPVNRTRERSSIYTLDGENVRVYLGTVNGTRVNFKRNGIWYHITKGDQRMGPSGKPNLYPTIQSIIDKQ